jgi:hypothetical protein
MEPERVRSFILFICCSLFTTLSVSYAAQRRMLERLANNESEVIRKETAMD